ncbi:MAG: putative cation:proton antiport protein [Methanomassiliicoccales archaeon PtaU1.Bin124]|nr:MAG: putative cation:proton antiport protein [Methanomassiliicoccales archaeon PtaU1.Bin124]
MDEETLLLLEIAMIMIAAGFAAIIFSKLRIPVMIGYLFAGMFLGPGMWPNTFVKDTDVINFLANLGIILLMFTIGLEFSIKRLRKIGLFAVLAGTIEVVVMIVIGYQVGRMLGWGDIQSIFLGAVLSISSTAVIIRVLTDLGDMKKPYADSIIGLLIIEDLAAVIILTVVSPLASGSMPGPDQLMEQMIGIILFLGLALILGIAVVPKVIDHVGMHYSDEVLLLVSLGFCFGMAIVAYSIGLSVAIGAFILGVIISESREAERISENVGSIKSMFMALFFVSIGLLIDPHVVADNIILVLLFAAIFIVGKVFAVSLGCFIANRPIRTSLTAGFAMVAMGEFSFVIAKTGVDSGAVDGTFYSVVIGAAIISMVAMPVLFKRSTGFLDWIITHAPKTLVSSGRRLESIRYELGAVLNSREDKRREISRQAFFIVIDFTILFLVQIMVQLVFDIGNSLDPVASWLQILPSLFLAIISAGLILPPIVDALFRVRKIGHIAVQGILERGLYQWDSGKLLLKLFVNFLTVMFGIVLFLVVLPITPLYSEFPLVIMIGLPLGIVLAWLLWDANKASYAKMRTILTVGLMDEEAKKE